ncbi:MAG: hypothetical protein N2049_07970 [Anaerolineales bacterium]|nr:hypothetical protein [Anaerolineales bacterium]MCX7609135.1 hypothetical protein [Anaerolineales bacterium]
MNAELLALSQSLVDELVGAVALPKTHFWRGLTWKLFRPLTDRFASLGLTFDRLVSEDGLPKASEWALSHFCTTISARGQEHIPNEGPLLITSNHPGAYDALVIFSKVARRDLCWISSEIPFLEKLPHLRKHIFFASRTDAPSRLVTLRNAVNHLRGGGALLYFGAGHRDPDPAVYPDAGKMIDHWRETIEFFLKHVPGLRLLPTVVSHVVSPRWARHPITWLRRKQIDRQRLSEFGQVISQLLHPGRFMASPVISFGPPAVASELSQESKDGGLLPAIIARQKDLLIQHCRAFGGNPGL